MNKEIHYEGWLIKSPPTKRIWRARWRRRWFTLKQGEIPEQFCLEYYTDRNCRKLKGVIDLDQCEQVDCGLRLENRKQKFQYMFDIKTPRRTYYLAADTETDMRDWVNCICQVCHLHDTSQSKSNVSNIHNAEISQYNHKSEVNTSGPSDGVFSITGAVRFFNYDSVKKKAGSSQQRTEATFKSEGNYVNTESSSGELVQHDNLPLESESQSESVRAGSSSNRCSRKIPGNLIIDNAQLHCQLNVVEPSPSFSTSSGPYIPISECFSGSSKFLTESGNPTTPLNNLDPKFYETPRCHNNIGLNLTNDQSYSPKITNFGLQYTNAAKVSSGRSSPTDSESVFTDEDDWTHPIPSKDNLDRNMRPSESSVENETCVFTYSQRFSKALNECNTRKSMRKSTELDKVQQVNKKKSFCLDIKSNIKLSKEVPQSSDTENTSPAIGADDTFSYVTESYDITRSHILPYYNISLFIDQVSSPPADVVTESRLFPNSNFDKIDNNTGKAAKVHVNQSNFHCFTNATQKKTEGHIFRYDFVEQKDLPPVNRKLKPKTEDKPREETAVKSLSQMLSCSTDSLSSKLMTTSLQGSISGVTISLDVDKAISPPSIDRKLKPNVYKFSNVGPGSRRSGNPLSLVIPNESDTYLTETRTLPRHPRSNFATCMLGSSTVTGCNTSINRTISISNTKMLVGMTHIPASVPHLTTNEHKLQYFDLDVANPPSINRQSVSVGNLLTSGQNRFGALIEPSTRNSVKGSVVYNSVDFVKTEAFKRIREERKKENESTNK